MLIHQLALNGANVGLDLLFVPVLGLGVQGVAAASVLAEYGAVGLGLSFVHFHLRALPGPGHPVTLLEPLALRALTLGAWLPRLERTLATPGPGAA